MPLFHIHLHIENCLLFYRIYILYVSSPFSQLIEIPQFSLHTDPLSLHDSVPVCSGSCTHLGHPQLQIRRGLPTAQRGSS